VLLSDLAEVRCRLGDYDEADALYKRSIALLKTQPQSARQLALVLGNQGTMYREMGQPLRSAASYEQSFVVARKAHLEKDPLFGAVLNGLAAAHIAAKGNMKLATRYLRESLQIREAALGRDHLDVGETLNNLGTVLFAAKDYVNAEAALVRAADITKRQLGAAHPDLAVTLTNLGTLYYDRQDYTASEACLREALQIREHAFPSNHPSIASSLLNLAQLAMTLRRTEQAQALLQRAVDIRSEREINAESVLTLERYAAALRSNGHGSDAVAIEARAKFMRAELKYVVKALK
jgi:tetratricopeptide (TPR) repeat protein